MGYGTGNSTYFTRIAKVAFLSILLFFPIIYTTYRKKMVFFIIYTSYRKKKLHAFPAKKNPRLDDFVCT